MTSKEYTAADVIERLLNDEVPRRIYFIADRNISDLKAS